VATPAGGGAATRQEEIERDNQVIEDLDLHIQDLSSDRSEVELDRLVAQSKAVAAKAASLPPQEPQ